MINLNSIKVNEPNISKNLSKDTKSKDLFAFKQKLEDKINAKTCDKEKVSTEDGNCNDINKSLKNDSNATDTKNEDKLSKVDSEENQIDDKKDSKDVEDTNDSLKELLLSLLNALKSKEELMEDKNSDLNKNGALNSFEGLIKELILRLSMDGTSKTEKENFSSSKIGNTKVELLQNLIESKDINLDKFIKVFNNEFGQLLKNNGTGLNQNSILNSEVLGEKLIKVLEETRIGTQRKTFANELTNLLKSVAEEGATKETLKVAESPIKSTSINETADKSSIYKEDSFLKNLISKDSDKGEVNSKILRTSNVFMGLKDLSQIKDGVVSETNSQLVVNKENLVADTIKAVKYMEINNLKNLTVKVMPKELGEIVIKLSMESGKMKLAFNSFNKETCNLLNNNVSDLVEKLNSQNLKIEPANINIYNGDTTFFSNEFGGQTSQNSRDNSLKYTKVKEDDSSDDNSKEVEEIIESNVNTVV
ncbi:flagellar hook-length control protein FliK [Haloimpatiens sp. FM7315]|uniref:flagellar hook-length control protein FliK n=1 Tax=Haloimpatiens sp. FM7315 TaxID=3298609 RepID=UPI0035A381E8